MTNQFVSGACGLEIVVKPGQSKYFFPDVSILHNKRVKYIDYCNEITSSPSGNDGVSLNGNITLMHEQKKVIDRLALSEIKTQLRGGNRIFLNHVFDFPNSFIEILTTGISHEYSMFFLIWYDDVENNNNGFNNTINISNFEIPLRQHRTYIPEDKSLKEKQFKNLLLNFPTKTALGADGIEYSTSLKSYLTLQRGSNQFFQNVPLYIFSQSALYETLNLRNITFDFTNSFIDVVNPTADDLKSVFFNCIF